MPLEYTDAQIAEHPEPAAFRRGAADATADRRPSETAARARRRRARRSIGDRAWLTRHARAGSTAARRPPAACEASAVQRRRRAQLRAGARRLGRSCSARSARLLLRAESRVLELDAPIDWTIIGVYLVWIVWDGLRLTKTSHELEGYFLGSRSLPWWAVGLSVMATQLSAITMIGTTGQGYADGMRFLQFYYALPLAMIVLSVTLVPFFHNAQGLHRLRVPGAALRREDARVHQPAVPAVAQHVARRRHLGAGGGAVGGARPERHAARCC